MDGTDETNPGGIPTHPRQSSAYRLFRSRRLGKDRSALRGWKADINKGAPGPGTGFHGGEEALAAVVQLFLLQVHCLQSGFEELKRLVPVGK